MNQLTKMADPKASSFIAALVVVAHGDIETQSNLWIQVCCLEGAKFGRDLGGHAQG
jgi:hypothetical protein